MEPRTYPAGVPSWIDLEVPDLPAAQDFYGTLFDWTFEQGVGTDADAPYVIARLHGRDAAGLGGTPQTDRRDVEPSWNTYVAVDDIDTVARVIVDAGGRITTPPTDVGEAGRAAAGADPDGAAFRLWQAGLRPGAQAVNVPGGWNFSDLHTSVPSEPSFYVTVFGWEFADLDFGTLIRRPGYGDHLAATIDPDIRERQASGITPPGFEDAIGWLAPAREDERPHWHVSFTVADRDDTASTAERLGGTVVRTTDTNWTREALIRDPQGGVFTASQLVLPER